MKERRKGLLWEMALILLTVAACLYSTGAGNIFGAKVDWSSQHSVFPEYFRQQFYRTGQFFPEFALNIGGGQNIYNFSYYGLFSPVVLIGYLLPNVKMSDYMMVASIVCLAAAVIILYRWLKSREFTAAVSGMTALMFLFAGPMIYQSSHQIMFVNYMPFLCLTFCGIDRYFEQKKIWSADRRNLSDDHDKLLFQHRWNTGAWSIWNLPVCKDKRAGRRDDYGKRISR